MKSFKQYKEELKGDQHKLDHDKDGKIEGEDLAKLRAKKKVKEEVEHIEEATHRDFASAGLMRPDMAKQMRVGQEMDFYARGTGDKMHGKVIKNDGKTVEVQVVTNPYKANDKSVHKFKIASSLPETSNAPYRNPGLEKLAAAKKKMKEEVEELDELDKSTLASYAKKATHSARIKQKIAKDFEAGADRARKPDMKAAGKELSKKYQDKAIKREAGVNKAIDRLAREEVELDVVKENMDPREYDFEGDMAKNQLSRIVMHAKHFMEMLDDNTNLPEWVQSKITKAEDYISTAHDYMMGEMNEEVEHIEEATPSSKQVKQGIGIARDKRYAGGNMTGAVKAMDKVNKGLAQHPAVKKELKKQNEEVEQVDEVLDSAGKFMAYTTKAAASALKSAVTGTGKFGKRKAGINKAVEKTKAKINNEEVELDEGMKPYVSSTAPKMGDKGSHDVMDKNGKVVKSYPYTKEGMMAAKDYLKNMREEVELEEKIDLAKASMGDVIKDFQASDAPQFKGKSKEERKKMALAAKLEADRGAMKEETGMLSFKQITTLHEAAEVIEEEMIGSSEFNQKIAAHQKAGNKVIDKQYKTDKAFYIVVDKEGVKRKYVFTQKGRSVENMGQTTNSEKPKSKPEEKRGRGRPKGSASGARVKGSSKSDDDEGLDDTRYSLNLPNRR